MSNDNQRASNPVRELAEYRDRMESLLGDQLEPRACGGCGAETLPENLNHAGQCAKCGPADAKPHFETLGEVKARLAAKQRPASSVEKHDPKLLQLIPVIGAMTLRKAQEAGFTVEIRRHSMNGEPGWWFDVHHNGSWVSSGWTVGYGPRAKSQSMKDALASIAGRMKAAA